MAGLLLLLALSAVMATASFLAGALPLSVSLSQSQLRLISSIGTGILVGTSLIVIIPEGIEAVVSTGAKPHAHEIRALSNQPPPGIFGTAVPVLDGIMGRRDADLEQRHITINTAREDRIPALNGDATHSHGDTAPEDTSSKMPGTSAEHEHDLHDQEGHDGAHLPTFEIGFSLIIGFVLMFLVDRLPKHATEQFHSAPATRHISLNDLSSNMNNDEDAEEGSFLGSLAPSARQSRSLATTAGLVIHSAADGIAMGASATTDNMELGFVIFLAIMIHKAPAAFGLTSVLLKQGLSKRAARGHLVVFSLAAPGGAISSWLLITLLGRGKLKGDSGSWWTGMLLLFSAGTFLYVAMHAMNQDHQEDNSAANGNGYSEANGVSGQGRRSSKPQIRDTLFTIAGMLLPLLTQFVHH